MEQNANDKNAKGQVMEILKYNREAWDREVAIGNEWTIPVSSEQIVRAKKGDWDLVLTPLKPVPRDWFPQLIGKNVLALAAAGGQQGPIFAAAGANVTVFDNSPAQLGQDRMVAERDGLELKLVEGDMKDLSCFENASFDLIFHPCSNCFVPDVKPVWAEAFRVLKRGGILLSGFVNPIAFAVDPDLEAQGIVQLKYRIPYSDLTSLTEAERKRYTDKGEPLAFGHTLEDQVGGQIQAGFSAQPHEESSSIVRAPRMNFSSLTFAMDLEKKCLSSNPLSLRPRFKRALIF